MNQQNICSICLDKQDSKNSTTLNCNHIFHSKCINDYKEHQYGHFACPLCRYKYMTVSYRNFPFLKPLKNRPRILHISNGIGFVYRRNDNKLVLNKNSLSLDTGYYLQLPQNNNVKKLQDLAGYVVNMGDYFENPKSFYQSLKTYYSNNENHLIEIPHTYCTTVIKYGNREGQQCGRSKCHYHISV